MLIDQINKVISEIQTISDYLYQQKLHKGYELLDKVIGDIMNIAEQLFVLSQEQGLQFDRQRLVDNLTSAMTAMEEKDSVLLADILVYEIAGQLLELIE